MLEARQLLSVSPYVTIVDNGPSSNRVDMVFLGDGYTASQLGTYQTHIDSMLDHMFASGEDPFPRYENFFNVHRVDVVSNESGADIPPSGIYVDTALDAKYYGDGVTERLLTVSTSKAHNALTTGLAEADFYAEMKLVTVNHTKYGGSGGSYAVYAGGNSLATEVALHELGHSFSDLADEYGSYNMEYLGSEPSEINVTKSSTGDKWSHWLGYVDPDYTSMSAVGAYEGARYYNYGLYRPTSNSKMRSLGQPFNAPSREKIILDIYDLVDPLDGWLDNSTTIVGSDPTLDVDTVDPDVIEVEWSVDGSPVAGADGESFRLADYGYGVGTYFVTARAYDPTDWVRTDLHKLEQTVTWSVTVELPAPAGVVGRHVFYNNSLFDGNDPAAGVDDDAAVADDKVALLPGETATFDNYTSYSRGINGVMIDVDGLPDGVELTEDDFEFRVGNTGDPSTWAVAAAPLADGGITVRESAGQDGSDRVTVVWEDNAIEKTWLQVTVKANANTLLSDDDVFYFGNAIGETGDSTENAMVTSTDEIAARHHPQIFTLAGTDNIHDFNRDGRVTAFDQIVARHHYSVFDSLQLITVPPTAPPAAPAGVVVSSPVFFDAPADAESPAVPDLVEDVLRHPPPELPGSFPAPSMLAHQRSDRLMSVLDEMAWSLRPSESAQSGSTEKAVDKVLAALWLD